jgi:choline transport protein
VIVFATFPNEVPVTLETANWAPAVWTGVILIAVVAYLVHGRKNYTPPVMFVEGRKAAGVGLQST